MATYISQGKTAKNLDLLHLASVPRTAVCQEAQLLRFFCVLLLLANVEQVNRIIIAIQSGELMFEVGAFPSLRDRTVQKGVGLVRPDVLNVSRASIPRVVKNRVLKVKIISVRSMQYLLGLTHWLIPRHLNLGVLPPRNLNDDVDDLPVILIWPCGNVVPK